MSNKSTLFAKNVVNLFLEAKQMTFGDGHSRGAKGGGELPFKQTQHRKIGQKRKMIIICGYFPEIGKHSFFFENYMI